MYARTVLLVPANPLQHHPQAVLRHHGLLQVPQSRYHYRTAFQPKETNLDCANIPILPAASKERLGITSILFIVVIIVKRRAAWTARRRCRRVSQIPERSNASSGCRATWATKIWSSAHRAMTFAEDADTPRG